MTGERDNLPTGGTDNAQLSETDTPETWDYYDPDEEQDNVETPAVEGTDDEMQEVETETEAQAEEAEDTPDDTDEDEQSEPELVTLADGTQVTQTDLIHGYMRQSDYTRKSQENANARERLQADTQRLAAISEAFVDHLTSLVPPEPDVRLASSNPNEYNRQKAIYEASLGQVQKLIEAAEAPKEMGEELSEGDRRAQIEEQNRMLSLAIPETGTAEGRKKFFEDVTSAAEKVGFTRQDMQQVTDHRLFVLAQWAQKGMAAEAAKQKGREKVQQAPAPRKRGQTGTKANRNVEAMRKLRSSGSIHDALAVDFE